MVSPNKGVGNISEGFTSRSVDLQTGVISPMEILHLVTNCRVEFILNYFKERFPAFTLASDVSFSRNAYRLLKTKMPITVETQIPTIGRSTVLLESKIFLPDRPEDPLFTGHESLVAVDLATRRSAPLPTHYVERFKHLENKRPELMPQVITVDKPSETLCQGVPSQLYINQVKRRHLDINEHVNILFYLEYCIDALEIHLQRQDVSCDFDDGCLQIKRIQYAAKGESTVGDILHVAFWDDEVDNSTVCFDISKSGKSIFQARMQFYREDHQIVVKHQTFYNGSSMYKMYRTDQNSAADPDHWRVSPAKGVGNIREGFTSRSLDLQTGIVSPWEMLYASMSARCEFLCRLTTSQFPCFLLTSDVVFSPDAYKLLVTKLPVTIETEMTSLRTKSGCFESIMFLTGNPGRSLLTDRSVFVSVDVESRKAIPFPESFAEMYKDLKNKEVKSMPAIVSLDRPAETECQGAPSKPYLVQVARRHLDGNGHVNIMYYLEYCIDALDIHLCRKKVTCDLDTDPLKLKRITFGAKGESAVGDILHVAFWDDERDNSTVCFDISRFGKCILQAKMQFYQKKDIDNHSKL